ncbi:MAG: hypothetical protein NTY38_17690 [Acidobacteria bacterium]|nr:hypothetical protein [Acidobacteriota bacterium]
MKHLIVVFFLLFGCARAYDVSDWDNLSGLREGQEIRVYQGKAGGVSARFRSVSPERLVVENGDGSAAEVPRAEVRRVDTRGGAGRRVRHAAIGAAIGFGGGFVLGAAVGGCKSNQFGPCWSRGVVGGVVGGLGMVVGAGVGAVLPAGHGETIYRAR